jgi:hypothetical protein
MEEVASLRAWSILVFFVKARVTGFEAHLFATHPHSFHVRADIEDITIRGKQRSFLAGFN